MEVQPVEEGKVTAARDGGVGRTANGGSDPGGARGPGGGLAFDRVVRPAAALLLVAVGLAVGSAAPVLLRAGPARVSGPGLAMALAMALAVVVVVRQRSALRLEAAARRATEAELRLLQGRDRVVLETAREGIVGMDAAGRIGYVNPAASRMLGWSPDEARGRPCRDVLLGGIDEVDADGAGLAGEALRMRDALSRGVVLDADDATFRRRDGTLVPVDLRLRPVHDAGRVRGGVLLFTDATQRRAVTRLKDEFVSMVSHELRTPLTSVRGSLGLLASGRLGGLEPAGERMLAIAIQNTDRLVRLINDILDIERIEAGRIELERFDVPARALVADAVAAVGAAAERAGVELVPCVAVGSVVHADPDRIVQALTNLLGNAVKFSPAGSRVTIDVVGRGDVVEFVVRDEGRGIPAEQLERVFDRFHQVDSSDTRGNGGSGLGLSIARGIVVRHGGRLWAESRSGGGTTFRLTLPAAAQPIGATPAADSPLVLVCDDDGGARDALVRVLGAAGYRAHGVAAGDAAVRAALALRPDVLLLDVRSADGAGADVVDRLRAALPAPAMPIVIVSVCESDGGVVPGAAAWLPARADGQTVLAAVASALARRDRPAAVLVVEDDVDLGGVIVALLERNGVRAWHAATGREAIRLSEETEPDLLVLDVVLPDGDAFAVVDWLRRHDRLRRAPLVVYSAREVEAADRERLRLGPTDFLTKGRTTPEDLERRVLDLLRSVVPVTVEAS